MLSPRSIHHQTQRSTTSRTRCSRLESNLNLKRSDDEIAPTEFPDECHGGRIDRTESCLCHPKQLRQARGPRSGQGRRASCLEDRRPEITGGNRVHQTVEEG